MVFLGQVFVIFKTHVTLPHPLTALGRLMPSPVGAWPCPVVAVLTDQGASLLDANQQGETPVLRELADKTPGDSGFLSGCLEMMGPCGGWKVRWGSKQMHRQW